MRKYGKLGYVGQQECARGQHRCASLRFHRDNDDDDDDDEGGGGGAALGADAHGCSAPAAGRLQILCSDAVGKPWRQPAYAGLNDEDSSNLYENKAEPSPF